MRYTRIKEAILKFALGNKYDPEKHVAPAVVVIVALSELFGVLLIAAVVSLMLSVVLVLWTIENIVVLPTGRYSRIIKDERPLIPYWPKVYGYNVWLWTVGVFGLYFHF